MRKISYRNKNKLKSEKQVTGIKISLHKFQEAEKLFGKNYEKSI